MTASRQTSAANSQWEETRLLGRELIRALHMALRVIRTHDWSNDLTGDVIRSLTSAVAATHEQRGDFGLHHFGGYLYIDETRLRESRVTGQLTQRLIADLASRGIGSILIHGDVSEDGVRHLLSLLREYPGEDPEAYAKIDAALSSSASVFSVEPCRDLQSGASSHSEEIDKRERCKRTLFRALTVVETVMRKSHLGRRLEIRYAKRVVQQMVDLIMDEEYTLLGLTTLKSYDNYTYYHSVDVCIYAIALGKRLGIDRRQLCDVGTAALLHDIGKVRMALELVRKRGDLTGEEWEMIREHPVQGVKELLHMGSDPAVAFAAISGAFEHHMNHDMSAGGYPQVRGEYRPHVIGRIVAIADCFDAMTTKRIYANQALRRDKALSYMMSEGGRRFDPVLLRVFANMIGVYPVGTAVRLLSGRLAVVIAASQDPAFWDRPIVQPITDEKGFERLGESYAVLDLSQKDSDGRYPDEIITALDATAMGLEVSSHFF